MCFFQHLLGFVVFLLCLLNCQCTNTMLSHYWQRNSTAANWLLTHTKCEQINQASIKLSQQTFYSQEMINLWYEHRRTKKAWLNTEIECHAEIASHHRNEKDNWMTITSILQFAFSETNRKQEKWWFHIFRNIKIALGDQSLHLHCCLALYFSYFMDVTSRYFQLI